MVLKRLMMVGMFVVAGSAFAEVDNIKEMKEILGIDRIKQDVADEDWRRAYTTFKTEGEGINKLYVLSKHEDEFENGVRCGRILSQKLNKSELLLLKKWCERLNLYDYDATNGESFSSEKEAELIKDVSKICPIHVVLEQFEKELNS